jgi:hypothetical protein
VSEAADAAEPGGVEFGIAESRAGPLHVVRAHGSIDVLGACVLGRRLLATLNAGAQRVLLDLSDAHPLASGALLGTVLRFDRYAAHRDARLVVLSGAATERMFELGNAHGHATVVTTRVEADALLGD